MLELKKMRRALPFLILALPMWAASFSGSAALDFTRHAVAFGPRPPGSEANHKLEAYIVAQLRLDGCEATEDPFTAQTPKGAIAMKNVICKFPGKSGRAIVITGHFDTKLFPGRHFVGADDGGSSTGLLLELGRVLAHQPRIDDVYLVFFDGEEAIREQWEGEDNLYGSRHLAERWRKDGTLARVIALINVDMIGDKNLVIKQDTNSDTRLRKLIWSTASQLGYAAYFVDDTISEEDDHMPFVKLGVPAVDVIDVDYPPWHTDNDTMDKLSAQSLEIVGTVMVEVIHRLEQ
ncbi:MAG TPA: M28 family peptidase [Bryobacteraceae bacterium]|jgi:glutaminyl-peptide cyclotransferase|nr:M28 family peptidase [Bryobacteraceae bacterium]